LDHLYRFRTQQIQSFEIGTPPDAAQQEGPIVLWTVAHAKEDNFLVANREPVSAEIATNNPSGGSSRRTPPVSLLSGSIPVQYQITDLAAWAYNNEDAQSLLEDLATRELVRFLVGADMNEVMSYGRLEAAEQLRQRIQNAADNQKLGARIVSVGLQDLHPPVKVAPDYEKVIGAIQSKAAKILAARADEVKTNALSEAQATNIIILPVPIAYEKKSMRWPRLRCLQTKFPPTKRRHPSMFNAPICRPSLIQRSTPEICSPDYQHARRFAVRSSGKIRADILNVGVPETKK